MTDLRAASNSSHTSGNDARALLSLDDDLFTAYFDRHPFKITHDLAAHPLLQLPRLVELARSLNSPILYFKGDHAINQVDAADGLDAKHTFIDRKLSGPELSAVAHHNTHPKPFIWTKSARDILQKVIRANSRLSSKQNVALH